MIRSMLALAIQTAWILAAAPGPCNVRDFGAAGDGFYHGHYGAL
jgi:hypothetical protein